jgi:hypothetical protein
VDERGKIKPEMVESKLKQVTRFSIRLAGQADRWRKYNEQPFETIQSGDKINLYCHSLGVGPYANIEDPPAFATPILYSPSERRLVLPASRTTLLSNVNLRELLRQYDEGTLTVADRMAFESKGFVASDDRIGKIKPPKRGKDGWLLSTLYSSMRQSGPGTRSGGASIALGTKVWEILSHLTGETQLGSETVTWKPYLPEDAELAVFTIIFE